MEAQAAVLRVRRKRGADPAEALLISCKRRRAEEGTSESGAVTSHVFRLATTLSSQNEPIQKYVSDAITRDRASRVLHPSLGSVQRIQKDLRARKDAERQDSRYRLISNLRPKCDDEQDSGPGNSQSDSIVKEQLPTQEDACAEEKNGNFQVFDVVHEEAEKEEADVKLKNCDPETIMCNSVKMIRERLVVSEAGEGSEHRESADEFVYDIYYAESSPQNWIQDILSVQPCVYDQELVADELEQDDIYEDEDDENEENNWRNDYPDEEDSDKEERYMGYYEEHDEDDGSNAYHQTKVKELEEEEDSEYQW
ncbi:probable RNA polymerase II nuclear localization protein SLC7A6OS [Pseudophryne corroboree]|uniref:probable RNA polymerase II nuclear localization protein SLC7A6OS n=1 Tax=Pseudophryne corroboree TaxID=495146 RepID=UPI00308169B7